MKEKEAPYRFHPNVIFRTPVIPFQKELMDANALFVYSQDPLFKEAIYLASPVLYDEIVKWHSGKIKDQKEIDKLVVSIYKYYSRMQSRCTPYGLFAGCGVGTWGEKNEIVLNASLKRQTRLDMNFLCALAQKLNTHPAIFPFLRLFPNNSAYVLGDQLRYVEYRYINNKRAHQISSVDHNDYLQLILDNARSGALPDALAKLLVDDEITLEDAEEFIKELINNQVLVSELEPAVTGDEFIYQIINSLKNIKRSEEVEAIVHLLQDTQDKISSIDNKTGNDIELYRNIYEQLKKLNIPIEENQLFQTDLFKTVQTASLDPGMKDQLGEAIDFLNHFTPHSENPNLKKFKEKFNGKFEGIEVPLLEVLDTDTGIGYPDTDTAGVNAFLDDINIQNGAGGSYDLRWNKLQEVLFTRLQKAFKNNERTVIFTEEDTKEIKNKPPVLPDSMAVMFRILGNGKFYFQSAGGSSAANLLGRFAHGSSEINTVINDITKHEQDFNSEKILAEIVHLPESRIGNILLRPVFRSYEIPYLGKSALPDSHQIQLQDLFVSVKRDKIVLRSKKLNKEIIPRLSSAHNYSFNSLPVYRFLCDLQTQQYEKAGLGFNWGVLSNNYKFLPRVEFKNAVISRAKWQLTKQDFAILLDDKKPDYKNEVAKWRDFLSIPQYVTLSDNDNELLINFEDPLSLKMLASTIKKRPAIALEEYLFDFNDLFVKDAAGKGYTNEFIAIALNNNVKTVSEENKIYANSITPNPIQRDFYIGSEWLYYKIYCGVKTADKILINVIKPLTEEIIEKKLSDKFFFIRYSDPDNHIRLRFHVTDLAKIGKIIPIVLEHFNPCIKHGVVTKILTDVYKRELERYGNNSIELAESFFYVDSVTTLNFLEMIGGSSLNEVRWKYALYSIDELLNTFNYKPEEKLSLLEKMKEGFFQEHGGGKGLKVQLDSKFRNTRKSLEVIFNQELDTLQEITPLIKLLDRKREELKPIVDKMEALKKNNLLKPEPNDLMSSYIHMMLNKIFMGRQRTCEMIIYDLLYRYYLSLAARSKNKKVVPSGVST